MVATATKRQTQQRLKLFEGFGSASAPLKIDREAGVIFGVKILGFTSPNNHGLREATKGTRYTEAAMRQALPLYEGVKVRTDHPDKSKPNVERSTYESFGKLQNVRLEQSGMFGDLHYLKSHPLANAVIEDVDRGMGVFGLSHNATGEGQVREGVYTIEHIPAVLSVDLVDSPATNRNLWESVMPQTTLRERIAALTLTPARQVWAKLLTEDSGMAGPMDAPVEAAATDPMEALANGFKAAINAVLDDAGLDAVAKSAKIKQLLQTQDKLMAKEEPAAPEAPAAESDKKDEEDEKSKLESLRVELATLKTKDAVRTLCESLDFIPDTKQLAALVACVSDEARRTVAESFKASQKPSAGPPRSKGPTLESNTGNYTPIADGNDFLKRITCR